MVSNISQIVNQLFQKETLDEVSENEIRYFIRQYPYAGTGHLLLAKKLQLEGEKRAFEREIAVTSIYFTNPAWLQFVLQDANGSADKETADAAPVHPAEIEKKIDAEDELESEEFEVEDQEPQPAEQPVIVPPEEVISTDHIDGRDDHNEPGVHSTQNEDDAKTAAGEDQSGNNDEEQPKTAFHTNVNEHPNPGESEGVDKNDERSNQGNTLEAPVADHEEVVKREDLDPFGFSVQEASSIESETDGHSDNLFYDDGEVNTLRESSVSQTVEREENEEAALSGGSSQEEIKSVTPEPAPAGQENANRPDEKEPASLEEFIAEETEEEIRLNEEELNAPWETDDDQPAATDPGNARSVSEETIRANFENRKHLTAESFRERQDEDDPAKNNNQPNAVYKEQPAGENKMEFDPYHTIDYFASQGIKLRLEDLSRDKLGQQLKSFTEWIRSMKRLPQQDGESRMDDTAQHSIRRIAEHSVEEKEVLTEAMAEVWAKQGNYDKARQIYRKLSLQNPSKSTYFAAKIDQLKVL